MTQQFLPSYVQKRPGWRSKSAHITLVAVLIFIFSACSILNAPVTTEGVTSDQLQTGVLRCSTECAARGQCGSGSDGITYVLGGTEPAVANHNLRFPTDSSITVNVGPLAYNAQTNATAEQFILNFYQVTLADPLKQGWVVEWCVEFP